MCLRLVVKVVVLIWHLGLAFVLIHIRFDVHNMKCGPYKTGA